MKDRLGHKSMFNSFIIIILWKKKNTAGWMHEMTWDILFEFLQPSFIDESFVVCIFLTTS